MNKNRKSALTIISVIVIFFIIMVGVCAVFFKNQFFISMPTSYICKQTEKKAPIGMAGENVIEFVKSHKEWDIIKHCDECEEFRRSEEMKFYFSNVSSFYSLSNIQYDETYSMDMPGTYYVVVKLGATPFNTFLGKTVFLNFIFDENFVLMDIFAYKTTIGF